jgi:hypothetical protein
MAEREAVEIVNFEVTGVGLIAKPSMKPFPAPRAVRPVYFDAGEPLERSRN